MAGRRLAVLFAGSEYASEELAALPFAEERAGRLAEVLARYGYECQTHVNLTGRRIEPAVRDVIATTGPSDVLIVYFLAHASIDDFGQLTVLGSDGRPAHNTLHNFAAEVRTLDHADVLLLADLSVDDTPPTRVRVPDLPHPHAWIIGVADERRSFYGTFSSAAAEALDALSRGSAKATAPNISLNDVAGEIWQQMGSSRPDTVPLLISVTDLDLPFFPNPHYRSTEPFHGERAWSVSVFELDGAPAFAVGTNNGTILCDVDGVPFDRSVTARVFAVAAVPGGRSLLCGGSDGSVTLRSLPGLSVVAQLDPHSMPVNSVAVATVSGRVLAASASGTGEVRLWELSPTIELVRVLTPGVESTDTVTFTDDEQPMLACGTSDGVLVMYDLRTGDEVWRNKLISPIHGLVAGTVGQPVLVCVQDNGTLIMLNRANQNLVTAIPGEGDPLRCVALVGDGRTAVVGGDRGLIDVVDLVAGKVEQSIDLEAGVIWSVAVHDSAQGRAVVAATDDGIRTVPLGSMVSPPVPMPRNYAGFVADVATGEDQLGITGEVNTLCDLVLAKEITPPLSIGLFGDWGTGKSFFMGKMRDRIGVLASESRTAGLEGRESALCSHVCQIEFNAWHYIDVDLWASLAATIFDRLASSETSAVLADLPSVRRLRDDLVRKRQQTRDLLDHANEELKQETPIGVRDVLTTETVRKMAGEAAKHVDKALTTLGVPANKVAETDLREVAETTGTLWRNLHYLFKRTRWPSRLLIVVGTVVFVAAPPVLGARFGGSLTALTAALASYVLYGFGVVAFAKPYLDKAARAVGRVKELVNSVDERRRAPVEARRDTLRQRMVEIDQEILGLDGRIQELSRGNSISAFALTRAEADHYRRHEGMVATLRRDLEEMSRRLTATNVKGQSADLERIVLYIDDLDRCPPRRVVEVLQAIHLLLAFPLFVVVVGVDSRWLLRSLDMFLRENSGGEEDPRAASTPQNYLEKIFQISQCLRPMSPAGYEDLISANVGRLEPGPEPVRTSAAIPADEPSTVDIAPSRVLDPGPPARRSAPPPVVAREVRTYRDGDTTVHLRFNGSTLESVNQNGVLTRRSLLTADPHEDRTRLVENTSVKTLAPVLGNQLIWVGGSGAVLIDLSTTDRRDIAPPQGKFTQAVVSPQTGEALLQARDGWYLWDLAAESTGDFLGDDVGPLALSRSWTVEGRVEGLLIRNRADDSTTMVGTSDWIGTAQIDPSERWLAVIDTRQSLHLHKLTDVAATTEQVAEKVTLAEFGPGGVIATATEGKVSVWDCATRALRAEVPADATTAIAFSPDGGRIATGNGAGEIRTWVIHNRRPAVDLSASALRLTEAERAMIVAVRPFIETPRSAKRLINTYRLVRAALSEADLAALREDGHRPVLLLLSVLLGEPEEATGLMRELLGDRPLPPTLTSLIRRHATVRGADRTNRLVAGRRRTSAPAGLEAKVAAIVTATGTTNDATEYRRWASVVARYSFRTLDL